jgi:glycolate oxidase FAD binding subunit
MSDSGERLIQQVQAAYAERTALRIQAGNSKAFLGNPVAGEVLDVAPHRGIVSHEPTELVLTAMAGTPLVEIESALAEHGQMLSFEPPHFDGNATIGGAVAAGLGGPRRPWGGAPRDQVLGVKLLDGRGQVLNFGGQVMKNVAGYDISRLMAGSFGELGVILEVSLKVLPAPAKTRTLTLQMPRKDALRKMRELSRQPLPLSGACHLDGKLYLRLSGSHASVNAWRQRIGGEKVAENTTFWQRLRDHKLDFFRREQTLWRLSLAGNAPQLDCEEHSLLDWAGAQRWIFTPADEHSVREQVAAHGGHAQAFRNANGIDAFQPMNPLMLQLHQRLKARFDPHNILNPGRLF